MAATSVSPRTYILLNTSSFLLVLSWKNSYVENGLILRIGLLNLVFWSGCVPCFCLVIMLQIVWASTNMVEVLYYLVAEKKIKWKNSVHFQRISTIVSFLLVTYTHIRWVLNP
jgi:hypothetical protein